MAKPKIQIDEAKLRGLLRLKPTLEDTAAFFECSPDTIERTCKRLGNCTFAEFREQNMAHTRFQLVREAISQATKGNTAMLIFCLKNLCKWTDKQEDSEQKISLNVNAHSSIMELIGEIESKNKK